MKHENYDLKLIINILSHIILKNIYNQIIRMFVLYATDLQYKKKYKS